MIIWGIDQQQSKEWDDARSGRPTASGFASIADGKGNKVKPEAWARLARKLTAAPLSQYSSAWKGNAHTRRGNELEPVARGEFQRLTGIVPLQYAFITRDDGIIGCSPDGIIADDLGNWVAGLEIKCPDYEAHAEYLDYRTLPDDYKHQVHGGMCVTGLNAWYFMSYHPGMRTLLLKVERDAFTERLSSTLDEFLMFYRARHAELLPKFKP